MARGTLHDEFTAIVERDEKWYIGFCPEIPGANGRRGVPADAVQEIVSVS